MSKRGSGGGIATVTRGLCDAYWSIMIEGVKTYKPEVKANKIGQTVAKLWPFKILHHGFYLSISGADA